MVRIELISVKKSFVSAEKAPVDSNARMTILSAEISSVFSGGR
jgi:hypothetical protein